MSIVSAIQSNFQWLSTYWQSPSGPLQSQSQSTEAEIEEEELEEKLPLNTTPQICFKRSSTHDANEGEPVSAADRHSTETDIYPETDDEAECLLPPTNLPTVNSGTSSSDEYPISLILPAPTINNMVFSGAGVRNVVLPTALKVLDSNIFKSLKHVSGASSGAVVATGIASSHVPGTLEHIITENPSSTFKEDVPNFETLYPDVTFRNAAVKPGWCNRIAYFARVAMLKLLTGDGPNCSAQRAFQIVDQITTRPIAEYLREHWWRIQSQEAKRADDSKLFTEEEMTRLKVFKHHSEADFQKDRTGKMVTFGDLSLMRRLDPSRFKDLTVVVWNQTQDKALSLSTTNPQDHDISIALAVRMSISIPLYFQSVVYKEEIYEDGGFKDRIPVEVFFDKGEIANTLVTDFYDNGNIYSKMYQKPVPGPIKNPGIQFASWLFDYPGYGETVAADNAKIYQAGPALYPIDNGNIGRAYSLSFNASLQQQEAGKRSAKSYMHQQVEMREYQAYALDVKDVKEAFNLLTPAQKKQVAASPLPRREDYPNVNDREFKEVEKFYNLAKVAALPPPRREDYPNDQEFKAVEKFYNLAKIGALSPLSREDYPNDQEFKAVEKFYNLAKKVNRRVSFGGVEFA